METRVFSTGNIDPKTVADQIKKGELGGTEKGEKATKTSAEATVQVIEGTNQIIVTDTPERLEILAKVMDEINRNIETRVVRPNNATPEQLSKILKEAFPTVTVSVDGRTGALVVTAHKDRIAEVEKLVGEIDANENIQVEIESRIMLVSTERLKQLGVRLFGSDLDGLSETLAELSMNPNFPADGVKPIGSTMGNPATDPVLKNPVKGSSNYLEALQPNIQIQAVVRAIESDSKTKLLSNPRLRMLAGQSSNIFAGSKEPYKTTTFQDSQSVENVQFENVGLTFDVTPYVSPNDILSVEVKVEFSTMRELRDGVPVVDTRKASSTIEARDNQTVMMGGLITEESSGDKSGVPVLKNIPGLGYLFGAKSRNSTERELVIVITPRILKQGADELASPQAIHRHYHRLGAEFGEDLMSTGTLTVEP